MPLSFFKAKQRVEILKREIARYRYQMHVEDKLEISEGALDSLKHELAELESQYPELITPDSPTQRVAGKPLDKFEKVEHAYPMLSISDVFDFEELQSWEERIARFLDKQGEKLKGGYFAEAKIDGLAVTLRYEDGLFVQGATRGDGKVGEDITQNLRTIQSLPLGLDLASARDDSWDLSKLEFRGEVYLSKKQFEELNLKQAREDKSQFANPRNAAAGTMRQLDAAIVAERNLSLFVYELANAREVGLVEHDQIHALALDLGFQTNLARVCKDLDAVNKFYHELQQDREKMPYGVDGMVVLVNSLSTQEVLGSIGKSPRWITAYKFPAEQVTTVIEAITVQVGRTGVLTPVAELRPVQLAGTTVKRATLHNQDEIDRKDIRLGDTVVVQKAGDIIPEVVEVLSNFRSGKEERYEIPANCPQCGTRVERREGEVAVRCPNPDCFPRQVRQITHWASKQAFDIEGLGPRIVEQLLSEGLIEDAADLFALTAEELMELEGFQEKAARNLVDAIRNSKKIVLSKFIYALGIPGIGIQTANDLAQYVSATVHQDSVAKYANNAQLNGQEHVSPTGVLSFFNTIRVEDLLQLQGLGENLVQNIKGYFASQEARKLFEKMEQKTGIDNEGVLIGDPPETEAMGNLFFGKTVVFTGSLAAMSRGSAQDAVLGRGGKVATSISKKVDFVVAGKDPGSKLRKAEEFGIAILTEEEFIQMLG